MKRLLTTVLAMEAVIALLAIVPAKTLGHASVGTAAAVCGVIALLAIFLCGYVGRGRTSLYVGSVFQVLVIASGVILPEMYFIGAIFAALWFTGIWLANKWEGSGAEESRAQALAAHQARVAAGQETPPPSRNAARGTAPAKRPAAAPAERPAPASGTAPARGTATASRPASPETPDDPARQ